MLLSTQLNVCSSAASVSLSDASSASAVNSAVDDDATDKRLRKGEVVVDLVEDDHTKFVVGKILINQPPAVVWPILVNPFEFSGKICPRMKRLDVLVDQVETSVLRCTMTICFPFPTVSYTVESKYSNENVVEFKRLDGFLKDFRGCWVLRSRDNGNATEVCYSMFVDPGIPIPKWMVREGVKSELPKTLLGLRNRVDEIVNKGGVPEAHSIMASSVARAKLEEASRLPSATRKGSI
ncbi:MAG TPA: hypothetical protein V6C81_00430 [Planktothrix sp.]